MKTTVCQLPDDPKEFKEAWKRLAGHVQKERSELVLLPEMPFYPWVAQSKKGNPETWKKAVEAHDRWQERFTDLAPATVLGSRPVIRNGRHFNEGFIAGPDGQVLGVTTTENPFITKILDLSEAEKAKKTYPRYVF